MRFLHTSDWHLGADSYIQIYNEIPLKKLTEIGKEHKVDFILCVGDVFDKPAPLQEIKDQLLETIISSPDIFFIFTVGNHDYISKSKKYHSLKYLQILSPVLKNVLVLDAGFYTAILNKLNLLVLPNFDDIFNCKDVLEDGINKLPTIVAFHGTIPGINLSNINTNYKFDSINNFLENNQLLYIALGDIHKNIKIHDRCNYPGSLIQKTYSCEDGILLIEMNGYAKTKFLRLDLPKRITIPLTFNVGCDSEDSIINFVENNVIKNQLVKLKFELPMDIWATLDKEYIKEKLSKNYLELKLENSSIQAEQKRKNIKEFMKIKSIFDEIDFIINEENLELDKDKLKNTCKKYIK